MTRFHPMWALRAAIGLLLLSGCTTGPSAPDLGGLYNQAAMHHDETRNPVIVIPGILGSRLVEEDTGRVVWGAFAGDYANPEKADGARLFALPMAEGVPLQDLVDNVRPDGALDRIRVSLFGLPIEQAAYLHILGTLGVGGYRDLSLGKSGAIDYGNDHYTCFQFDYDWRRDLAENAQRFHEFLEETRMNVAESRRQRYGIEASEVRFDIVAHSMGGLLTRYYLRFGGADLPQDGSIPDVTWAGTELVDRVVLVGTPNAGSTKSLSQLVDGVQFASILPKYEPALVGTEPAVYQLLPRLRHRRVVYDHDRSRDVDFFDIQTWIRHGWGLAGEDQDRVLQRLLPDVESRDDRRRIALDHLQKCLMRARQFHEAMDQPVTQPADLELFLIAGDAVGTDQILSVDSETGRLSVHEQGPGDGTVTRQSALLDERVGGTWQPMLVSPIDWTQVTFLFDDHLGLTKDPAFTDNVLYVLLEAPRRRLSRAQRSD